MKKTFTASLLAPVILFAASAVAKEIDVTKELTSLECRARGGDADPYYFETKSKRNPGDPEGQLSLLWRYNSIFNTRPIAYFDMTSVIFDTETEIYTVTFHLDGREEEVGTLTVTNGAGGEANFYNTRGSGVYQTLSRCSVVGEW